MHLLRAVPSPPDLIRPDRPEVSKGIVKVLIVSTNRSIHPLPVMPLGACLAAETAVREGCEVELLDLMFERNRVKAVAQKLESFRPDLVGVSLRNIDNNDMLAPLSYADEIRPVMEQIGKAGVPAVLGGASVSVMPEQLLRFSGASLAVLGDAENVFPEIIRNAAEGTDLRGIPGTVWLEGDVFHSAPLRDSYEKRFFIPDFRGWVDAGKYLSRMASVPLQTKLGCHFECVYCTYPKIGGSAYRLCPPGEVAANIGKLVASGFRDIEFVDNVFNSPYGHAIEICEHLARNRSRARLQSLELNPLFIDDEIVSLMEAAGFRGMGITVESASDRVLRGLKKGFTSKHVCRSSEVIRDHSIPCLWIFLLGGPGETDATVEETMKFAAEAIRPGDPAFFNPGIRIYPGTGIEEIARAQGVLSASRDELLEPAFYFSPEADLDRTLARLREITESHMNFISAQTLGNRLLSSIQKGAHFMGIRPPLWRYGRHIRRCLKLFGMDRQE